MHTAEPSIGCRHQQLLRPSTAVLQLDITGCPTDVAAIITITRPSSARPVVAFSCRKPPKAWTVTEVLTTPTEHPTTITAPRRTLGPSRWVGPGHWTVDTGRWTLDGGQWTLDSGQSSTQLSSFHRMFPENVRRIFSGAQCQRWLGEIDG